MWMMGSLVGAIVVAILAYVFVAELDPALAPYMLIPVALTTLGATLIAVRWRRVGAYMVLVGSVPLMPIGLISVPGANRALDMEAEKQFLKSTGGVPGKLTEPDTEFVLQSYRTTLWCGGVFAAVGLVLGTPGGSGLGIAFVLFGLWSRKNARLRMHRTYMDLKEAPGKARRLVRYADVEAAEWRGRKAIRLTYRPGGENDGEKPRQLRVKLSELTDADRLMLYLRLRGELNVEVPQLAATA